MTKIVGLFEWTDDGTLRPAKQIRRRMDDVMVVGQTYVVEAKEYDPTPRSSRAHRRNFAELTRLWHNLPEEYARDYPTAEHFRKKLLISEGYYTVKDYAARDNDAALTIAAFVRLMDEYAVVVVSDDVVRVYTAKSQAETAMDKKEFYASMDAIISAAEQMIGIER